MTSTLPEEMRERANTLYRPDLTDLELNEHQGKERLVVYLDDVITLLEDTDRKAREEENRLSLKRIEKMVSNRYFVTEGLAKRLKAAHRLRIYKLGNLVKKVNNRKDHHG